MGHFSIVGIVGNARDFQRPKGSGLGRTGFGDGGRSLLSDDTRPRKSRASLSLRFLISPVTC